MVKLTIDLDLESFEKLKRWLEAYEYDISHDDDSFDSLKGLFKSVFGRDASDNN